MTQAKYQVFISSTFEDLKDERNQVIRATLEMGHIPVGMEMFSAADEEQWQIIARHIDESDYYAVVIAHRYGSLTPEGISYTRKEYEYAIDRGVPCLGFVLADGAMWPGDRIDDGDSRALLDEFKTLVRRKPVSHWTNAEDLHSKFSVALMKSFNTTPRDGWVRASSGGGPEVMSEVVRLSSENAVLRKRLAEADAAIVEGQRDDIQEAVSIMRGATQVLSFRKAPDAPWETKELPLIKIFGAIVAELVVESTVEALAADLCMHIQGPDNGGWDIVAVNQVKIALADLMALGLVQPSERRHAVSDSSEYWSLSPFGVEVQNDVRKRFLASRPKRQVPPEAGGEAPGADATGSGAAAAPRASDDSPEAALDLK